MEMRAWREARTEAEGAARSLREALAALDVAERDRRAIRPVVTASGRSCVYLGMVRADVVLRIAEVLWRAAERSPAEVGERKGRVEMRWLDTGSGPGAMVPVLIPDTDDTSG
ncbi:hypothetical protein [Streptomyces sp. NPDC004726]